MREIFWWVFCLWTAILALMMGCDSSRCAAPPPAIQYERDALVFESETDILVQNEMNRGCFGDLQPPSPSMRTGDAATKP
jgi:hypothetical protein